MEMEMAREREKNLPVFPPMQEERIPAWISPGTTQQKLDKKENPTPEAPAKGSRRRRKFLFEEEGSNFRGFRTKFLLGKALPLLPILEFLSVSHGLP